VKLIDRRRRYNAMLMAGNIFLVLSLLSQRLLPHALHMNEDLTDGINGLFVGLTIGCFIVGVRKMMRGAGSGDATA